MRTLGVVCAKSDSQRLKNKNILEIDGVPMAIHAWEAVRESCDYSVMLTDIDRFMEDKTINTVFQPVHTRRPNVPIQSAVKWVIRWNEHWKENFDTVVYVMANCPESTAKHVKKGLKLYEENNLNVVRSYNKNGVENGLHIYRLEYFLKYFCDVYVGMIIAPGIEIHTIEDLDGNNENKKDSAPDI